MMPRPRNPSFANVSLPCVWKSTPSCHAAVGRAAAKAGPTRSGDQGTKTRTSNLLSDQSVVLREYPEHHQIGRLEILHRGAIVIRRDVFPHQGANLLDGKPEFPCRFVFRIMCFRSLGS